jgi:choline dehydrogenase-like flavoprotein
MGRETVLETDICIVGAGAAGITIAGQLDGTSRDVCLVEAGGRTPDQETQSLYDLENLGYPIRENFMSRARYPRWRPTLRRRPRSSSFLRSDTST